MADQSRYDAFMSYSHAADDLLAPRLQAGLQRFAKPWWKRRATRVFRDESSLSANPHLWSSITDALDDSEWFVLLLSPEAATSEWVNNEIEYWTQHKGTDRILPVVTEGHFDWQGSEIFPPALRFADEPRWVDLRFGHTDELLDLNHAEFRNAVADIASAVRGIPKDELASEEVRQHRRTIRTAWAAGIVVLLLGIAATIGAVVAVNQSNEARRLATAEADARADAETSALEATRQAEIAQDERDTANEQRDRADEQTAVAQAAAEEADLATIISRSAALSSENPEVSILLALEAHRRDPKPATEQAVLNALGSSTIPNRVSSLGPIADPTDACTAFFDSSDGTTQFGVADGLMVSRDSLTGETVEHGPPPAICIVWVGDELLDRRAASSLDGLQMWIGPYEGAWEIEKEFAEPTFLVEMSLNATNKILVVTPPDGLSLLPEDGAVLTLLDAASGESVGTPITGGVDFLSVATTEDGSLIAIGYGIPAGPDGDGLTIVADGNNGEEIFRVTTPLPAGALTFDEATGQLLAMIIDGSLVTIDLSIGEIVSEVESGATSFPLALKVRPDGLILAVTSGQVEVLDRRNGSTDLTVELRDVGFARIRPDGTVLTVTSERRTEIIDLNGNALVEQSWEVDTFAVVAFNDGRAGAVNWPNGDPEVIDLATGVRSTGALITSEGERFAARTAYPEPDGIWAYDIFGVLSRWKGGRVVARIDLPGAYYVDGARLNDTLVAFTMSSDGETTVMLVRLGSDEAEVVFTVPAPNANIAHPTLEGGVHVIDEDGTLHSYDPTGAMISEIETGAENAFVITLDPNSGKLAVGAQADAMIIDPATGDVEPLGYVGDVANLGFARGGTLLAVTSGDGTVRLWDLERNESAGLVWDGSGVQRQGSPPWYDEATDSLWVSSSGQLLQIPLNPERWIERACEVVGRDLTQEEWDRYVPGGGEILSACAKFRAETDSDTAPIAAEPTATEPAEENVTVEGEIDFDTSLGSFTVTDGSEVLGCEAGTQEEMDGAAGVEKTLTCESGSRSGTFTITFVPPEGTWKVTGTTGDFEGLSGGGDWSGQANADGSTGSDTWSGEITFADG